MRLIVTRPEEDATALKTKLESMGHAAVLMPLLKIVPRPVTQIPPLDYQLVCSTSANALKYLGTSDQLRNVPILTVGPQSLAAARTAGFKSCAAKGGDVHGLAAHIIKTFNPDGGPVLYLSGKEISADLQALLQAAHFKVEKLVVYDAVAQKPANVKTELAATDGVLLYSPRSARIWMDLVTEGNLESLAAMPVYYCLSENVAKVLPHSWQTRVANSPDEIAMIALLA